MFLGIKRANPLVVISVLGCATAVLGVNVMNQHAQAGPEIPATITLSQALSKVSHVQNAVSHSDGAAFGLMFSADTSQPKVDISSIIQNLVNDNNLLIRSASSIQVEYTDLAGFYRSAINPAAIQADPALSFDSNGRSNPIPVWLVVTPNQDLPLLHSEQTSHSNQTWTMVFDANTGDELGSYITAPNN